MTIARAIGLAAIGLSLAACSRGPDQPTADNKVVAGKPPPGIDTAGVTPMAERVAVIALLNKRNGIVHDFTLKPGDAVRVKDITIQLRACDSTAPWETERLTGAFVQLDNLKPDGKWYRVFSGWLYKESPSLNVVEHPVYDAWVRSCAMTWPGAAEAAPSARGTSNSSSAPKSGGKRSSDGAAAANSAAPADAPPADPVPSATESNAT